MFLVIRVRGTTGVIKNIANTLDMLRLNRISHAVLVEEKVSIDELGGVQKGKGSQTNKSKGNLSMTGPSKRDDGLSKK